MDEDGERQLYALDPAGGMYFHLFHFVGVKFLLNPLSQGRRQSTPCCRLASAVINRRREGVVYGKVACKSQAFVWGGCRSMCQRRWCCCGSDGRKRRRRGIRVSKYTGYFFWWSSSNCGGLRSVLWLQGHTQP